MPQFNPAFIRRLALGDPEAHNEIKELPLTERVSIGFAVRELTEKENIVPMNPKMSIYEQKVSDFDENGVAEAMKKHMEQQREAEEHAQKMREEFIAKEVEAAVNRSRAGLPRNDQLPR